jgi:DNA-binding MarR family transcriptional regulator
MNRQGNNDGLEATVDLIASECLAVRTRLLNRTVTNIFDEALRPLKVKVSQLNVLIVVAKRGPISPGDVARRLNMEKSTLSRNVERMRTRGWLKVSQGDTGRQQILEIGAAGRKLIETALPVWKEAQAKTEAMLGQRGARSLHRAADAVWAQLGRE